MNVPPPLPTPSTASALSSSAGQAPEPDPIFIRQCALTSLACPIAAVLLEYFARQAASSLPESSQMLVKLGAGSAIAVLGIIGVTLGVIAFRGTRPRGRPRVRAQAFLGTTANVFLLLAVFALARFSWSQAYSVRRGLADLRETIQQARVDQQQMLLRAEEEGEGDLAGSTRALNETLSRVQDKLTVVARQASGSDALTLQATKQYLTKLQEHTQCYEKVQGQIQRCNLIDASNIQERSELGARRRVLREFLDTNDRLHQFMLHAEENMRAELDLKKVEAGVQQKFLNGFRKAKPQHELVIKIRETDRQIGESAMALMNLYDQNWGEWHFDSVAQKVVFESQETLLQYQSLTAQIQAAAHEQEALRKSVLSMKQVEDY